MSAALRNTYDRVSQAILGNRRIAQDVRIVITTFGGAMGPLYTVLVTPAGHERGDYFECGSRALEMLREGRASPGELELSAPEDEE